VSECNNNLAAKGEHPGQKQLGKIHLESNSTRWIDLWNKEEERMRNQTKPPSGETRIIFYKKEDLRCGVKTSEITHDENKPLI
jgi:hypothetical protein